MEDKKRTKIMRGTPEEEGASCVCWKEKGREEGKKKKKKEGEEEAKGLRRCEAKKSEMSRIEAHPDRELATSLESPSGRTIALVKDGDKGGRYEHRMAR